MGKSGDEVVLVGAIDQGTSSSRFLVFTLDALKKGEGPVCSSNVELKVQYPEPGWAESDAEKIYESVVESIEEVSLQLENLGHNLNQLSCVGVTNQRETTLVWNRKTGEAYAPAISWQDGRSRDIIEHFKQREVQAEIRDSLLDGGNIHGKTGLVMSEYSCCSKLAWLLKHNEKLKNDLENESEKGNVLFGTVDVWLLWKLTKGREFSTDVSNASRTNFMSLHTLDWDAKIIEFFQIHPNISFPVIKSNSEDFGTISSIKTLEGVPITGCMGDQHASLVGHHCFEVGQTKNTYGTGLFLLTNIGNELKFSKKGVLTTIGYQFGKNEKPCFAMEGAIASGGSAIRWLRDSLGLISSTDEVEWVASQVEDSGGVYFVPAFSGLFTPYWDSTARAIICGMSHTSNRHHIARAVLDSLCYQTRDVLDTISEDSGLRLQELRVDGGASLNNLLMQTQANILNMPIIRPASVELTAYGAALAAAFGAQLMKSIADVKISERKTVFSPKIDQDACDKMYELWKKAVNKSQNWL